MRPVRAKALIINAFALAGRFAIFNPYTQGAALGYVLLGLSARFVWLLTRPLYGRFEKESFWVAKRVLLVSKRGPFEGQKDNYWKAKGVVFEFWILSFEFWIVLGYACDFELFNFELV